jgi:hypothetical protein
VVGLEQGGREGQDVGFVRLTLTPTSSEWAGFESHKVLHIAYSLVASDTDIHTEPRFIYVLHAKDHRWRRVGPHYC